MLEFFLRSSHGLARARSSSVGPYLDDFAAASRARVTMGAQDYAESTTSGSAPTRTTTECTRLGGLSSA